MGEQLIQSYPGDNAEPSNLSWLTELCRASVKLCTRGRTRRGASTRPTATGHTVTRTSLADRTRSTTTQATGMASTTTRAVPTSQVASRTRHTITTIRGNPTTTELPFPDSGARPQRGPLD